MATDSLSYSGINRAVSDFSGAKFCEELINLRPTTDGLVPVKPFSTKFADTQYSRIFVHHTTDGDKYIGVRRNTSQLKVYVELIGTPAVQLFERGFSGGGFPSSQARLDAMQKYVEVLSFAAAGNVVLFSAYEKTYSLYDNHSFIWKAGAYEEMEANVPELDFEIDDDGTVVKKSQECAQIVYNSTEHDVVSSVENAVNAVQEINPELCLGPFIVATAFKTKDGNTFWTGNWKIYDPVQTIGTTSPPYEDETTIESESQDVAAEYEDFFDEHGHGYRITPADNLGLGVNSIIKRLDFYGTIVKVSIGALSSTPSDPNYWNKNTSMIQSVEVYASRPAYYFDTKSAFDGFRSLNFGNHLMTILLVQKDYKDMDLGGMPLYHQASIPMESLLGGGTDVELKFGGNLQVTNETLRVDAGAVTRFGKILSYNSRFHYYDSVARTEVGAPSFSGLHEYAFQSNTTYIFVRHSDESGTRLLYMGSISGTYGYDSADITIAPSVNIKEVILYSKYTHNDHAMYRESVCRMTASGAYNFSIGNLGDWHSTDGSGTKSEYETLITANAPAVVVTAEPAAINVTEQYNPFVFRVEHSYLAPGNVIDVVPQNYVVTDATYGREPLDVFTTQGVYALIQGNGEILYSWFDPISPMISEGPAVPTEMGIFFISRGSLYLCAGHRTTLVSDALSVGPHKYVRACAGYKKISGQDSDYSPSPVVSSPQYDVSTYLSKVDFETFASGNSAQSIGRGRLSYNRFRQEVYISNASFGYSYVLSLKYRQWFKVPFRIWQDEQASVLANLPSSTAGRMNVVDLSAESSATHVTVHMQSRPFSMGYQYIHMHRLVAQMRAELASGDLVVVGLYGSDDLQNWNLLAYAKRAGASPALKVSQIRTTPSARSWRYYTICLGGTVYAGAEDNTDIGPFLVDYEPVVRRIG